MELRERVLEALLPELGKSEMVLTDPNTLKRLMAGRCADAAIAAVLDAMQDPSEGMLAAIVSEPTHLYGLDGRGAEYERDMKNAVAVERLVKRQDWQDMLAAFRTEQGLGE